jgi:4-amino-4-deoxy-L-arabinose transferase-like glycosyltransferase
MESKPARLQAAALAALAAGLLLRLWFLRHAPTVSGDSLIYGSIAKNWLTRGIYGFYQDSAGNIAPTLIRLPGYPILVAASFRLFGIDHYGAVRNLQVTADLVTCCLSAGTAIRLFGMRAGLAVLWLAALCPFTANYVAAPLTETLVLLTIAAAFYAYVRWRDAGAGLNRWTFLIAAALAYSVLLRPDQLLLALAVLPAMLWTTSASKRTWRPAVVCIACVVLPLVPWTIRNWRTFHVFQPLAPKYANDPGEAPPLGFARWYRSWAIEFASTDAVYWNYNGFHIEASSLPARAFDAGSAAATHALRQQTLDTLARYNVTTLQTPEIEAAFAALARERVHAHPIQYYVLLPTARLADMVLRPRTEMLAVPLEWWSWRMHPRTSLFAAAYALLNFAYLALGIAGFLRWRQSGFAVRGGSRVPAFAWATAAGILLRCALLLTIDNAEPRYTIEFFPVLLVCAGALFAPRELSATHQAPQDHHRPSAHN